MTFFKIIVCLVMSGRFTGSIFLPYRKGKNHTLNSFHIPLEAMALGDSKAKKDNPFQNISMDERCLSGKPLSIAWHPYAPYVTMYQSTYNHKAGFTVSGMFPGILIQMMRSCCHPDATCQYGKLLRSVRHGEESISDDAFDFIFPLYGYDGFRNTFRNHPFIPLVRAPGVILLVKDNQSPTRTHFLVTTIISAWPMLVFILLTASLSGIIIWFLDHSQNPKEFPPPFLRGVWEGFWWALVTMTTVGYGDRSPKSALGRAFCIVWIISGVIIVSIFTALVTASLSASTYPNFNIHGSKIGAVNGSEEFRLGVSMNADMKVYFNVMQITMDLLKNDIDGALVDNYVMTHFSNFIKDEPIRVEKYINHPITFGVVLSKNSSYLENCMRQYIADYPHEVFESIAEHLNPLKNPTDDVSQQLKAAEALFYQEWTFIRIVYGGLGTLAVLFLAGIIWEFAFRRKTARYKPPVGPKVNFSSTDETAKLQLHDGTSLDDLISQYQTFHDSWIENLQRLRDQCDGNKNKSTASQ